jgi:hypothetical protein
MVMPFFRDVVMARPDAVGPTISDGGARTLWEDDNDADGRTDKVGKALSSLLGAGRVFRPTINIVIEDSDCIVKDSFVSQLDSLRIS